MVLKNLAPKVTPNQIQPQLQKSIIKFKINEDNEIKH